MRWAVLGKGALGPELKDRTLTLTFPYEVITGELLKMTILGVPGGLSQ